MHISSRTATAALVWLALFLGASASAAHAAGQPATVTVRVEGFGGETLLPQTQVTTSTTPVAVEGGFCTGTSAGGALFDATHGNWKARLEPEGVEIDGIEGLTFPSFKEHGDAYWAFWLNDQFAEHGACGEDVSNGAAIVFAAQCIAIGPQCPGSATAPDHFLTAGAPSSSSVNVGEPMSIAIGSLNTGSGAPEGTLPQGVVVTAGPVSVIPGARGIATLTFASPGTYTLQARAADSVPSDPRTVCVHNGNDGTCGTLPTAVSGGSSRQSSSSSPAPPYSGPYALVARATGPTDGRVYSRRRAPRLLTGTVTAHTAIASVSISLRRRHGDRCSAYSGVRALFVRARCGQAPFFRVSKAPTFSYLLPNTLAAGRYVLDIEATDVAGNHTSLARGTSRIVFYVR
jgi:hypothetical protein